MADYPLFDKEKAYSYKILLPNMAPLHFPLLKAVFQSEGFDVDLLESSNSKISELGLRYVHNDTCYPALLVIGQLIDALNSGTYDPDHTALIISQSGGGCRASNYIMLLRKALKKAGYPQVPVASINPVGLEKESQLPMSLRLIEKLLAAGVYGDVLFSLRNQIRPYEAHPGETDTLVEEWTRNISEWFLNNRFYKGMAIRRKVKEIVPSFARIERNMIEKVKVGVVGEIYVKFSPFANNYLQDFLESEGCEVCLPGLMGYVNYCIANFEEDIILYGGSQSIRIGAHSLLSYIDSIGKYNQKVMKSYGFYAEGSFRKVMENAEQFIHLGAKMGEGWLLSGEMAELIEGGYTNIICAQPFGCLPNHIMGKGVMNRIRSTYPQANVTAIDYDPSAAPVNQENRIRLMLSIAKENLHARTGK